MRKLDLNAIYISERVQETLRPVSVSALTAVVAPMGYGKTTAINWFLNQRKQTENAVPSLRFLAWKVLHFACCLICAEWMPHTAFRVQTGLHSIIAT